MKTTGPIFGKIRRLVVFLGIRIISNKIKWGILRFIRLKIAKLHLKFQMDTWDSLRVPSWRDLKNSASTASFDWFKHFDTKADWTEKIFFSLFNQSNNVFKTNELKKLIFWKFKSGLTPLRTIPYIIISNTEKYFLQYYAESSDACAIVS